MRSGIDVDMENASSEHRVTFYHVLLVIITFQLIHAQPLWAHFSEPAVILGRYSPAYALVLALWGGVTLGWLAVFFFLRQRLQTLIQALPTWLVLAIMAGVAVAIVLVYIASPEGAAFTFLMGNGTCVLVVLIMARPDGPFPWRHWPWGTLLLLAALLIPLAITITVLRDFDPDEANWIDRAKSLYMVGGAYAHHIFYEPVRMELGRGWFIAVYTWLIQHFGIDVVIGRMLNLVMYVLALVGVWLVTWKLYDRVTAFTSVFIAALGSRFFYAFDYRQDHFVAVGQTAAFFAAVAARQAERPHIRYLWHFLCGLLITLSMQLHASAIGFVFGLSLFYAAEFIWITYRQRRVSAAAVYALLAYGLGALIGVGVYWQFNIQVFGLSQFLANLQNERGDSTREFLYLFTGNRLALVVVWAGLAYLAWRRTPADRLYLGLWLCSVISITLVDTQGYAVPYVALMFVPAGVPLIQGLRHSDLAPGRNIHSVGVVISVVFPLLVGMIYFIDWPVVSQTVQTGLWPRNKVMDFGEAVLAQAGLQDDEMVIATHELVWVMPQHLNFYSPLSEGIAAIQRDWSGTQVWDYLSPDVYLEIPRRIATPPGLQTYLEREHFQVCDQFDALGYLVRVYRRTCASPPD